MMKLSNKLAAVVAGSMVLAQSAMAALPAEVDTMFTSVGTDAGLALGKGWVLFAVVTGGFVLFKIVKKAVSKAT